MTHEDLTNLVNMTRQIATRRNKAIAVFKLDQTYYIVDACEWENGCAYGQYITTVEPEQNPNRVFHFAGTFANQT